MLVCSMEEKFLDFVGVLAHDDRVVKVLCSELCVETNLFCTTECHRKFVNIFIDKRFKWHLRFVNRSLKSQRSRHSGAARKMRKLGQRRRCGVENGAAKASVADHAYPAQV